ncbi:hypothetical protein H6F89_29330 [Cyanobacteria bacterium FACHB-63]|nr:hypothetical protein [Cyanobacteria bacterium FACHB-63]
MDDATELATGSVLTPNLPREPETEKGRWARSQYLALAQAVLNDAELRYETLYQRYAANFQEARSLDQSVAALALQSGTEPKIVIQLLAQGPFTQHQTQSLTPEQKKAAIPGMLQYSQAIVDEIQQQRYVEYANAITGKTWNYPDLYREHIGSDLTAIQLDQRVAAAALQAGESVEAIVSLLQQSPYSRFQVEVKKVKPATIEQYARGTVAQVQDIQSRRPAPPQRQQHRSKQAER